MATNYSTPQNAARSQLMTGESLAKQYGNITYDEDVIRKKFDAATQAEYALKQKQYAQTERNYADQMYTNQLSSLDTLRKANATAISSGASRGAQAAQELSAILGLQDAGVEGATELATAQNQLADKEAAAYTQNAVSALETANATKQALATLGANVYAADTQYDVGLMQQLAQLDANVKNLSAADRAALATEYAANQSRAGQVRSAQLGLEGTKYNADQNLAGNQYTANKNLSAAVQTALQNRLGTEYASRKNLEGNKYTADKNLLGTFQNSRANVQAARINAEANQTPTLEAAVTEALKNNQTGVAVALVMQATGMTQKEAENLLLNQKIDQARQNLKTSDAGWLEKLLGEFYLNSQYK